MSMILSGSDFLSQASKSPMIPVFNHDDKDIALGVVQACYQGGIRLFEFTNRSEKALKVFEYLLENQSTYPEMTLGVGSILNLDQCESYYEAGAGFIVAPIIDKEVAVFCKDKSISWSPGCGTLTELVTAERLGAELIKVFPADVLGPKFIKGVLGPCSQLKLMPTGGVSPTEENLKEWFSAGVTCVGMGSQLFPKEVIQRKDFNGLAQSVKKAFDLVNQIKSSL